MACVVMRRFVDEPAAAAPFARRSAMKPAESKGSSVNCAAAAAAAAKAAREWGQGGGEGRKNDASAQQQSVEAGARARACVRGNSRG